MGKLFREIYWDHARSLARTAATILEGLGWTVDAGWPSFNISCRLYLRELEEALKAADLDVPVVTNKAGVLGDSDPYALIEGTVKVGANGHATSFSLGQVFDNGTCALESLSITTLLSQVTRTLKFLNHPKNDVAVELGGAGKLRIRLYHKWPSSTGGVSEFIEWFTCGRSSWRPRGGFNIPPVISRKGSFWFADPVKVVHRGIEREILVPHDGKPNTSTLCVVGIKNGSLAHDGTDIWTVSNERGIKPDGTADYRSQNNYVKMFPILLGTQQCRLIEQRIAEATQD